MKPTLNYFPRKIKLKAHFNTNKNNIQNNIDSNHDDENNEKQFYIKNKKSTWEPYNVHHTVNTFIEAFNNELNNQPDKNLKPRYNLTKSERKALEDLKKRTDIVITNVDRGGAVVIQDVKDYIKEANKQLNNRTYYQKM